MPQPRPPNHPQVDDPIARVDFALHTLARAITDLVHVSTKAHTVDASQLELLRLRRGQLSAVIDRLGRYDRSPP